MGTHQKSKVCRRSTFRLQETRPERNWPQPGMASSPSPTTPLTNKLQGNSPNSVNIEPSKERPRPLVGEDSPGRDPLTRASDTLSSLGSTMDISERIWEHVVMVDETGLPIAVGHDGADSDDESICSDSSSPAAEASIQRVMGTLVELVAPGDGGAGLAAAERKRVFEFADACLAHGGSSQTITDILRSATRPGQGISPGSFDSNRLLETYLETICSGDGWVEETFTVATGHAVTSRWNSKIVNDLVELVQDPVLFENMILRPHYDGKRFGHPTTGLHMQAFYSLVRKQRKAVGDWNKKKDVVLHLCSFPTQRCSLTKGLSQPIQ